MNVELVMNIINIILLISIIGFILYFTIDYINFKKEMNTIKFYKTNQI